MSTRLTKEQVLRELSEKDIVRLMEKSRVSREKILERYPFLRIEIGLAPGKIRSQASLLGRDIDTINSNFEFLNKTIGIAPEEIRTLAHLLGSNPNTIRSNFKFLNKTIGIAPEKIRTHAQLLGRDPNTIQYRLNYLISKGMPRNRILAQPAVLGALPQKVLKNYRLLSRFGVDPMRIPTFLMYNPEQILSKLLLPGKRLKGVPLTYKFEKLASEMEGHNAKDYKKLPAAQKEEYANRKKEFVDWARRILSREAGIKAGRQGGVRPQVSIGAELAKRASKRLGAR